MIRVVPVRWPPCHPGMRSPPPRRMSARWSRTRAGRGLPCLSRPCAGGENSCDSSGRSLAFRGARALASARSRRRPLAPRAAARGARAARRGGHPAGVLPDSVVPPGHDFPPSRAPRSRSSARRARAPHRQVRQLYAPPGSSRQLDYPLSAFGEIFASDVPSTVAAVWGTVMWCAYAPAFDGNERLITVFGEYLRRSLPGDEWVRWLPAPPLLDLVTLVAERLRAGQPRAALRLAAMMADTAQILLLDTRFRPRALALLTMVEPMLRRPGLDDLHERRRGRTAGVAGALPRAAVPGPARGDRLRGALLPRPVRPRGGPVLRAGPPAGGGRVPGGPVRLQGGAAGAAGPSAAAGVRGAAARGATGTSAAESTEPEGLPARTGGVSTPPAPVLEVAPPDRAAAAAVLGAAYATGLAWGRLDGGQGAGARVRGAAALVTA